MGTDDALHARLLGRFRLEWRGERISPERFARRKVRNLLQLLLLAPRNALPRDAVLETLWPDLEPDAAASQLYNHASRLRRALAQADGRSAKGVVVVRGGMVALEPAAGVHTDVDLFRGLADRARRTRAPSDLQVALEAYGGPLLPDEAYEEWLQPAREELEEVRLALLMALGHGCAARADHSGMAAAFRQVMAADPLREEAHRGLMAAYAAMGETARAEEQYRACESVLQAELGVAPSPETKRLYGEIAARNAPGASAHAGPLDVGGLPFVGRQFELSEIASGLTGAACRVLTLTGVGGIGKTRLAVAAANRLAPLLPEGVRFVSVPEGASRDMLAATVAVELGIELEEGEAALPRLIAHLADRRTLVVLDGAEQAPGARDLVRELLATAPHARFLVTSRHRLGLREEWVMDVRGLEVPRLEAKVDPVQFGSVQIFLQAARRVRSDFAPDDDEMAAIRQICRLLGGVPLALELAASWVRALSCRDIAREVERSLDLLASAAPDVPERHRSLRSAFAHSWRLLGVDEQHAFARLSVFRGGFTRDAAAEVAGLTIELLASLIEKSLVQQTEPGRYEIHLVLRQFAAEMLEARRREVEDRHAAHYLRWIGSWQDVELRRPDVWRDVSRELENVRAAWAHAATHARFDLLDAALHNLYVVFDVRGWHAEGTDALRLAVTRLLEDEGEEGAQPRVAGRMLTRLGSFERRLADRASARTTLTRAIELLELAGDQAETAYALDALGVVWHEMGDDAAAREVLARGLELRERSGDPSGVATSLNNIGSLAYALGDLTEAERLFRRALELRRATGETTGVAVLYQNLASIAQAQGDGGEAESLLRRGLQAAGEDGHAPLAAILRGSLARAALARGDRDAAGDHLADAVGAALAIGSESLLIGVLPDLAAWLHRGGREEDALAVCEAVRAHPAAPERERARADAIAERVARDVPGETREAVLRARRETSVWRIAERFAAEALRSAGGAAEGTGRG